MPRIPVAHGQFGKRRKRFVVFHGLDQRECLFRVRHGIQRVYGLNAAPGALAAFPFGFHLLNVRAVAEHYLQKVTGGRRAIDSAGEAVANHAWQQAGVVNMRMRDEKELHIARGIGGGIQVALVDFLVALMHAAIHGKAVAGGLHHMARPRNSLRGPEELNLHAYSRRCLRPAEIHG
jgi:hypothetical protein